MRVDDRMTRGIVSCGLLDDLVTAASRLWENDCGSLRVLDEQGHVAGTLTDRDICMAAMFSGKELADLRVAEVVTRDVTTAREQDTLHDAETIVRARSVPGRPVVEDHQRVVAIPACNDLLRWVDDGGRSDSNRDAAHLVRTLAGVGRRRQPFHPGSASPATRLQPVVRSSARQTTHLNHLPPNHTSRDMHMRVSEYMMPVVITCHVDDSLDHAARLLWDRDCGCLPVVDHHGRLRGMITDRDICMAAHITGQRLQELQVREAMAIDVVTTRPDETTRSAELLMREHRVRRLPVLDDQERIVGMFTCNDLVRWVDDAGTTGRSHHDSVHLIRTLASIGAARASYFARVFAPAPATPRDAGLFPPHEPAPTQQSMRDSIHAAVVARSR